MKKHPLCLFLFLFAVISIFAIGASDPFINVRNYPLEYCFKQIQWYIIAFLIFYCITKLSNEDIFRWAKVLYGVSLLAVALLALQHQITMSGSDLKLVAFSHYVNGATAWYEFPGIGTVQPSEFLKMAYLLLLADIMSQHQQQEFSSQLKSELLLIGKTILLTLPVCLAILLQNDTGVMLIVLAGMLATLWVSGLRLRYWLGAGILIIGCALFIFPQLLSSLQMLDSTEVPYYFGRILGWMDPETHYSSYGYQLFNALLSSTTAGLWGHGFQAVVMPFPEPQTDFIYAIIVSNTGLLGGALVILLIIAFDLYLLSLADKTKGREHYLFSGLVGILFFQQFWNIGMILGLVPITGITLPLISYGGSSLLSYMMMFALVFNFEKKLHQRPSANS